MDWNQKAHALNSLSPIAIRMRGSNDWYVEQSVEVKRGRFLVGEYGNGVTPSAAVLDHWDKLVSDLDGEFLVLSAYNQDRRREVRWTGFMWEDV